MQQWYQLMHHMLNVVALSVTSWKPEYSSMEHLHNGHFVCYVMFPMSKNVFWNLIDIQAEHSYSLSEDSAPQSPALSIKMDQESGRSSYSFKGFIKLYIHLFFTIWLCIWPKMLLSFIWMALHIFKYGCIARFLVFTVWKCRFMPCQ